MEGAFTPEYGRAVSRCGVNDFAHLLRVVSNDEERLFLITLVERVHYLRGGVLEDDGVERLVPAEGKAGHDKKDDVEIEDDVPGVDTLFFEKGRWR